MSMSTAQKLVQEIAEMVRSRVPAPAPAPSPAQEDTALRAVIHSLQEQNVRMARALCALKQRVQVLEGLVEPEEEAAERDRILREVHARVVNLPISDGQ